MREVGKYNLFKGISTVVTTAPIAITAFLQKDAFIKNSGTSISFAAIVGILLAVLFLKNKIAENFKLPSAFVIATVLFVTILVIEQILIPVKYVSLVAMICCGIDELSFKRIYERIELLLPENKNVYKHFGFYMCKSETLLGALPDEQI